MPSIMPRLAIVIALYASQTQAEPPNIKSGLWSIKPEKTNNIKDRKTKYTCIDRNALTAPSQQNMLFNCTGNLLTISSSAVEWRLTCPNAKTTKWKMRVISPQLVENFSTSFDTHSSNDEQYTSKSIAEWISADCGAAPQFPKIR
ncbi:DUF3617 family protein [Methylomonas fluvii]|uniref:DUF3617 family protein n=1 Tax=Methylomonas fluvii TaxID=1854564 RepID=A0ABR9DFD8_9GAMM|nr:DUF3617 family protein [Methylomonas fluvii]MBD9361801.1 DUF3617 family protein [Methylomonas fluvii]